MCLSERVDLADIDDLAHRAVRLAGVELDRSCEADCLDYKYINYSNHPVSNAITNSVIW